MRYLRIALATLTIAFALFFTGSAVLGAFDYVRCRQQIGQHDGLGIAISAYACNYDMRFGLEAAALALAFAVATYFILRRLPKAAPATAAEPVDARSGDNP